MAARPRTHKVNIPNLYCKLDRRTSKVYWQYRHPITGKFIGFGTDGDTAREAAIAANTMITEQQSKQINFLVDMTVKNTTNKDSGIRVADWVNKYLEIQEERVTHGEIRKTTFKTRKSCALVLAKRLPNIRLSNLDTKTIAAILDEYKAEGKTRMAQILRAIWGDLFKEAQHSGEVEPGFNPALATRIPKAKVSRARLSFIEWQAIYAAADNFQPYVKNSMLIALVTGQRRTDICNMKFSDVWDGHLHITQSKTGSRLALPLTLRLPELNMTLGDAIKQCRDRVVSKYIIHHTRTHGSAMPGDPIGGNGLSRVFMEARNLAGLKFAKGSTPPSFHEQRSLAERLYSAHGVDTQTLLGHKTASMTEKYHDDRGAGWTTLAI
ncbi:phage integrase Arm DNA-binding domain-containing protein [Rouxiella badensis]|uniref:phage integrase Arm DNA-binding domain-containing protein n=1 Tax=Rouxiella badensis TaxID=1646377 RepID=UPI001D14A3E3|nr:phage integrase Arm DNA-binding domain-containing protein [Rouxiella badensis]MCC3720563.1 phage integrase Arm DNA-binding domain-containing protein [Rouxiella badensis]MCC3730402.1 phage integrase Arm DNA-binding domain-containing protein [Rouxiella badensis]